MHLVAAFLDRVQRNSKDQFLRKNGTQMDVRISMINLPQNIKKVLITSEQIVNYN